MIILAASAYKRFILNITTLLLFVSYSYWSWYKWPDLLVDFGHELYVPWRISEGAVLYKDLAHLYGPLSQIYHSIIFSVFLPSYSLIVLSNFSILVVALVFLFLILKRLGGEYPAHLSLWFFISIFCFSEYTGISNYNFISPYAHESTHGFLLLTLLMHALLERKNISYCALLLSLIFFTRVEILFSSLTLVSLLILKQYFVDKVKFKNCSAVKILALSLFLAIVIALIISLFFGIDFYSTFNSLRHISGPLTNSSFFKSVMGTDAFLLNLTQVFLYLITCSAIYKLLSFVFTKSDSYYVKFLLGILLFYILSVCVTQKNFNDISLIIPSLCVIFSIYCIKVRDYELALFLITAFSLTLKIILNARFGHYGFYLLPLACSGIIIFLHKYSNKNKFFIFVILLSFSYRYTEYSNSFYIHKTNNFYDQFYTFSATEAFTNKLPTGDRVSVIENTLRWLSTETKKNATLAVIPDGSMINFLLKKYNPSKYHVVNTTELIAFNDIKEEFSTYQPDWIVLYGSPNETSEMGQFFENKQGKKLVDWIFQNYQLEKSFVSNSFIAEIYKFKNPPSATHLP